MIETNTIAAKETCSLCGQPAHEGPCYEGNSDANAIRGMLEAISKPVHVNCDCEECSPDKWSALTRLFEEANEEVKAAIEGVIGKELESNYAFYFSLTNFGLPKFYASHHRSKLDVSAHDLPDLLRQISAFKPEDVKAARSHRRTQSRTREIGGGGMSEKPDKGGTEKAFPKLKYICLDISGIETPLLFPTSLNLQSRPEDSEIIRRAL